MKQDEHEGPGAARTSRRHLLTGTLAAGLALAEPAAGGPKPAGRAAPARAVLDSLLERNHRLSPEYGGGLSNHVSMALYSLSALGGGSAELRRFADAHWSRLDPWPAEPGLSVTRDNWRQRLGRGEAINGFRALFAAELARHGREATLRHYLPDLLPGVAAGAFHSLIRTAYGVRFGDDREVADGLAYWAIAYLPLGELGAPGGERDPRAVFARIHERSQLVGQSLSGHLITGRMKSAAALPDFRPAVDALAPSDTTLQGIAAAVLRLYLLSGDFTALHAVTGTHAYRMLSPYVVQPERGLRYLLQALAAAYVSVGAPAIEEPPSARTPAWEPALERARVSLDAHDLKLVDIAREESSVYGDPLYQRAAALRMRTSAS